MPDRPDPDLPGNVRPAPPLADVPVKPAPEPAKDADDGDPPAQDLTLPTE